MVQPSRPPDHRRFKRRLYIIYAAIAAATALVWGAALLLFHAQPLVLGTCLLAYIFGLRHAVDADHIAAIDNVTRKLMQENKRPVTVGFYFALGHSSVVIALSALVVVTADTMRQHFATLLKIGGLLGTGVSAFFLLGIAAANLLVLTSIYRTFCIVKRGGPYVDADIDLLLAKRGLVARVLRQLFHLIDKSWHMLPLGFLFGLGFDTATEVAVLGMSASQSTKGMPIWQIMIFPALFTIGMVLIDTMDSTFMLGAYQWAFVKPIRKIYYNMIVTLMSVLMAALIGIIEALGVLGSWLGMHGGFWNAIDHLNDHLGLLGAGIVVILIANWLGAIIIYQIRGYDRIEVVI